MDNNLEQSEESLNTTSQASGESSSVDSPADTKIDSGVQPEVFRPSLARRLHLKLFLLVAFMAVSIYGIFYYQNHSLPSYLQPTADAIQKQLTTQKTFQPQTSYTKDAGSTADLNSF